MKYLLIYLVPLVYSTFPAAIYASSLEKDPFVGNYANLKKKNRVDARVSKKQDTYYLEFVGGSDQGDQGRKIRLYASENMLKFRWTNPETTQCDNPGCGDLIERSGVIEAKNKNGKTSTILTMYESIEYLNPENSDDPEGIIMNKKILYKVKI